MKKTLLVVLLIVVGGGTVDARARTKVRIYKEAPSQQPSQQPALQVPVAVIPPLAVFYDLARRVDCRGDVLGMGGAGFDAEPKTGNFLIPAIYRKECQAKPKR
jgi:hypothetical protein